MFACNILIIYNKDHFESWRSNNFDEIKYRVITLDVLSQNGKREEEEAEIQKKTNRNVT